MSFKQTRSNTCKRWTTCHPQSGTRSPTTHTPQDSTRPECTAFTTENEWGGKPCHCHLMSYTLTGLIFIANTVQTFNIRGTKPPLNEFLMHWLLMCWKPGFQHGIDYYVWLVCPCHPHRGTTTQDSGDVQEWASVALATLAHSCTSP